MLQPFNDIINPSQADFIPVNSRWASLGWVRETSYAYLKRNNVSDPESGEIAHRLTETIETQFAPKAVLRVKIANLPLRLSTFPHWPVFPFHSPVVSCLLGLVL